MAYCTRCRIGTLDAQGLCVLCGASQTPPTVGGRLAGAAGAALGALLSLPTLAVALIALFGVGALFLTRARDQVPAGAPLLPLFGPAGATGGQSLLMTLLLPALFQALLLVVLVITIFLVFRRRRERPGGLPAREVGDRRV